MHAMSKRRSSLLQRILRRFLVTGRGEVRALEDAIHLEGVLRFVALLSATIVLPSLLLAYFGFSSIRVEQLDVLAEVTREASGAADTFWASTERGFSNFESQVRNRLEAGRSPLESRGELHPHLLVALRFDESGELIGPFVMPERPSPASVDDLFDPALSEAVRAEHAGADPAVVARLYTRASRRAPTRSLAGRAQFDRARMLASSGKEREALTVLEELVEDASAVRDPWGVRLGDLARLERAELLLDRSPQAGADALQNLVDDLLTARWTAGYGGEAAVARRALSLLEPYGEREWAAVARGRLAERNAMLYWTGELMPELQRITSDLGSLRVAPGLIRWRTGEQAVWATTWWDGDFYAFGIDREAVLSGLKADARGTVLPDAQVDVYLVGPDEQISDDAMVTKSLGPWLSGWSVAVSARNPEELMASQTRKRNQRVGVIVVAVVIIGVGAFLSAVLVKRELDVARMKTDFASSVSHELRSPITQIRLKGEALMLGLAETGDERQAAYQAIVRESERLSRLVDNVLDFAAIERGAKSYSLRPGDLVDSVLRAVDSISSAQEVADKELDIDLPGDLPVVWHDPDAVAQCVINLVSNAAKYSSRGARIGITGRALDNAVEVDVSDRGIGIAPQDADFIFEPFFRGRSSSARRRKGTGIGLTITRYIMHAHGGEVSVRSRPGEGSTFTLRFPLQRPPRTRAGASGDNAFSSP